jgi:rubrerythrin
MYPVFIEVAKEERNDRADRTFALANAVEKVHHGLFEAALNDVKEEKKPADVAYYVCQVCGNTVAGSAPDKCSICGATTKAFIKVD